MNDSAKDLDAFLQTTLFVPSLRAADKPGVLAELADAVVAAGVVPAERREDVRTALADREEKMSTGMQNGVAIPHAKTDLVDGLVTLVALAPGGIPFDTLDGAPATIFIATLSPPADANSHIRFLAVATRRLSTGRVREKVLAAKTKEELLDAFAEEA